MREGSGCGPFAALEQVNGKRPSCFAWVDTVAECAAQIPENRVDGISIKPTSSLLGVPPPRPGSRGQSDDAWSGALRLPGA